MTKSARAKAPAADPASDPASDKAPSAREKVATATTALVDTTTDTAREIVRRTSVGIEANPMSVLVGGVALGVLFGAILPRTGRETAFLAPVGRRLTETAKGAFEAAKETARSEFDVLGLTRAAVRGNAGKLFQGVLSAVAAASSAAIAGQQKKAEAAETE